MEIGLLRSSSYGTWHMCQQQYYMIYGLGYQTKPNKKAILGTITHKVMEVLANCKKTMQDSPQKKYFEFKDEELGPFEFTYNKLMNQDFVDSLLNKSYEHYTTNSPFMEFDHDADFDFSKTMVEAGLSMNGGAYDPRNQNIFKAEQPFNFTIDEPWATYELGGEKHTLSVKGTMDLIVKEGEDVLHLIDYKGLALDTPILTREGWSTMGELKVGDIVYDMHHRATKIIGKSEVKHLPCYEITFVSTKGEAESIVCDNEHLWIMANGEVKIVTDLKQGDIIPYCGHEYEECWNIVNIRKVESVPTQCIKVDSHTSSFLCGDWKIPTHNTGQRKNWATGEEKTYEKLHDDFQLMLYYYAMSRLFPEYPTRLVTIIFLRDGGPFTMCYEDDTIDKCKAEIKTHLEEVLSCKQPKLVHPYRKDFKCYRLCEFYKEKWPGTNQSKCEYVENHIRLYGIEKTSKELKKPGFSVGFYSPPGATGTQDV